MTADTSILGFMLSAGLVVKIVMLILILASVFSWMMIIQRYWLFRRIKKNMYQFYQHFKSAPQLAELNTHYKEINDNNPLQTMFKNGYFSYHKLIANGQVSDKVLNGVERSMYIAEQRSLNQLEQNLGFLATVGSTSPYIGLFGTVWGIMTSFSALGGVQQATISMVAPGISEALIATAFGLFAAIPAVIAYNRFTIKLNELQGQYDIFKQELLAQFEQLIHFS